VKPCHDLSTSKVILCFIAPTTAKQINDLAKWLMPHPSTMCMEKWTKGGRYAQSEGFIECRCLMILMCPHLHILQRPSPMPLSFTVFEASDFTSPSASGDRVLGVQISCGSGVTCGAWLGCQIEAFHPKSFIKSVES